MLKAVGGVRPQYEPGLGGSHDSKVTRRIISPRSNGFHYIYLLSKPRGSAIVLYKKYEFNVSFEVSSNLLQHRKVLLVKIQNISRDHSPPQDIILMMRKHWQDRLKKAFCSLTAYVKHDAKLRFYKIIPCNILFSNISLKNTYNMSNYGFEYAREFYGSVLFSVDVMIQIKIIAWYVKLEHTLDTNILVR